MKKLLTSESGKLNIDVVVVAIPNSVKIANVFIELGIPHVIGFDFIE